MFYKIILKLKQQKNTHKENIQKPQCTIAENKKWYIIAYCALQCTPHPFVPFLKLYLFLRAAGNPWPTASSLLRPKMVVVLAYKRKRDRVGWSGEKILANSRPRICEEEELAQTLPQISHPQINMEQILMMMMIMSVPSHPPTLFLEMASKTSSSISAVEHFIY